MNIGIHLEHIVTNQRGFARLKYLIQALSAIDSQNQYRLFTSEQSVVAQWKLGGNFVTENPRRRLRMLHRRGLSVLARAVFRDLDVMFFPTAEIWYSKGCPTVVTLHDLAALHFPDRFFDTPRQENKYHGHLRQILKNADALVTVSQWSRTDIASRLDCSESRIAVIYQGISPVFTKLNLNEPEIHSLMDQYGIRQPFILYAGSLDFRKNIQTLIDAFGILKEDTNDRFASYQLGSGGQRHEPSKFYPMPQTADFLTSGRDVIYTGYVEDSRLVRLVNLASVVVYPSLMEGFGYPPLEAMQCATPVVCSNAAALPETCGNGALLVSATDSAAFAEAIGSVLTNKEIRMQLVAKGLENVRRFSWLSCARDYLAVFRRLGSRDI